MLCCHELIDTEIKMGVKSGIFPCYIATDNYISPEILNSNTIVGCISKHVHVHHLQVIEMMTFILFSYDNTSEGVHVAYPTLHRPWCVFIPLTFCSAIV